MIKELFFIPCISGPVPSEDMKSCKSFLVRGDRVLDTWSKKTD